MKSQEELKADIYAEVRERLDLSREMEDGELWDLIYRIIAEKSE